MESQDNFRQSEPKRKRKRFEDEGKEQEAESPIDLISDDDDGNSDSDESDDDEDDEYDDDEGEGTGIVTHDEDDEPFPECAAYDKDFDQVGQDLVGISNAAIEILQRSDCTSRRVQNLQQHAEEVARRPQAKREKIALLGDTGAGKSSVVNSLIGLHIAKAMAGGQSCTYVGTQYEHPFRGQTKKFAARVEYFGIESIRELLDRLLKEFFTWNFERQDDWTEDEQQELSRLSRTAFSTFRALFCDQTHFDSSGAATNFLQSAYRAADNSALETFVSWCNELLEAKEADEDDHIEYLDADTKEELLEQLDPLLSSNSRYDTPTLCPLVKKVRVAIEGPRILQYMDLIDLPGLDDTNRVRVNASLDIMRTCDSIWVVTKIDRAITETSVDGLLMRYGKYYKMAVVCTGIDEHVESSLAKYLYDEGQSIGNHQDLLEREKALRRSVRNLPKKIETQLARLEGRTRSRAKERPKSLTDAAKERTGAKIVKYRTDLQDAEADLKAVAQERFNLLVDARNAYTIRRLKEEKSDHLPVGDELNVFCVSNSHYAALKGARIVNGPRLDAEMTGVPSLRKYILETAAPYQLQAMEDFIKYRFNVFMQGLAMWAKTYSVENSEQLLRAVKEPQGSAVKIMDDFVNALAEAATLTITEPLLEAQPDLVMAASKNLSAKTGWHWGTMRAFIRRDGNHHTSIVPQ